MRVQLRHDERGAVALTVVGLLVPFLIISAFVVDIGMTYAQGRAFSTGADSAALAVVAAKRAVINASPDTPVTCASIVADDGVVHPSAHEIATAKAIANQPFNVGTVEGMTVSVSLRCVDKDGNPDPTGLGNLKATVTVTRDVPTTLGGIVGVPSLRSSKDASAALGVARQVSGIFPLGICESEANEIVANATAANSAGLPYPIEQIAVDKVWKADCSVGGGSGNWGWLNCGSGVSAVDIGMYISQGCKADLTLSGTPPSVTIEGSPGNKINSANVTGPLDGALGKVYAFPVYERVNAHGSNTEYRIIAFIQLRLDHYDKDGNIYVQYVNYSPVGDINAICGIGGIECTAYNAWAIGLIK